MANRPNNPPRSDLQEEVLIAQAKAGDRAVFGVLVEAYGTRLFTFLVRRQGLHSEAQDLCQIVFLRAWTKLETFCPERGCFWTWLLAIANRVVVSEARRRREIVRAPGTIDAADSRAPSPDDAMSSAESKRSLWTLVDEVLAPHVATVVWLRYGEDLAIADIARVLGWTTVRVRVTLFRARQQLLRALESMETMPSFVRPRAEGGNAHAPA